METTRILVSCKLEVGSLVITSTDNKFIMVKDDGAYRVLDVEMCMLWENRLISIEDVKQRIDSFYDVVRILPPEIVKVGYIAENDFVNRNDGDRLASSFNQNNPETLIEAFDRAYESDTEPWEKKGRRIFSTYDQADPKQKELINDIFISLCGYSLDTLLDARDEFN